MLYNALASSGHQLQRQVAFKSWLGASGPDCHLTTKIRHLQENRSCIQILDTILTRVVIDSMFVYHFVDSDLRVRYSQKKEGTTENGGVDF